MTILGFVQTNNGQVFELVDEFLDYHDEYHAQLFIESYPNKYVRVIDRAFGTCGVYEIQNIKLIFRVKKYKFLL